MRIWTLILKLMLSVLINSLILCLLFLYTGVILSISGIHYLSGIHNVTLFVVSFFIEIILVAVACRKSNQGSLGSSIIWSNLPTKTLYHSYLRVHRILEMLTGVHKVFVLAWYILFLLFLPLFLLVYMSNVWLKI